MFAIIAASGKQYRVEKGQTLTLDRLDAEVGADITFDQVLLVADKETKVGTPTVKGAQVVATVTGHTRGDKVTTFKYKPRKRTRVKRGYRHSHTTLEIKSIKG